MEQDRQKRSHITNISLFARVIEKVTSYALNHILNYREEMEKAQKAKKRKNLFPCTGRFYFVINLPCVHTIQKRIKNGESLRPEDFDLH
jgi:hypothetical protein